MFEYNYSYCVHMASFQKLRSVPSTKSFSLSPAQFHTILHKFILTFPKTLLSSQKSYEGKMLTKKISGFGAKTLARHPNTSLRAIGYLFAASCRKNDSGERLRHSLMNQIRQNGSSYIHLLNLPEHLEDIGKRDLAGFTLEMLKRLNFITEKNVVRKQNQNLVLAQLLSLFFRVFLFKLKMPLSQDYTFKLQTKQIFTILSQYFDLNCQNAVPYYIFPEQQSFILSADDEEFVVGNLQPSEFSKENMMISNLEYISEERSDSIISSEVNENKNTFQPCEKEIFFKNEADFSNFYRKKHSDYDDRSVQYQETKDEDKPETFSPSSQNGEKNVEHSTCFLTDASRKSQNLPQKSRIRNKELAMSYYDTNNQFQVKRKLTSKFNCHCNMIKKETIRFHSKVFGVFFNPEKKTLKKQKIPDFLLNRRKEINDSKFIFDGKASNFTTKSHPNFDLLGQRFSVSRGKRLEEMKKSSLFHNRKISKQFEVWKQLKTYSK